MSFIDTPATSSSSTPANSRQRGKRPAVPRYAQMLSTFEALDLFANDETAQKICLYFEDPDTILAIDELAKVSRAHQQEEREIHLARHRSRVRQTMATILLDQLQSWGLERELYDVLKEYCCESPTAQKPMLFLLVCFLPILLLIVEQYNFRRSLTIRHRFHLLPPLPQDLPSLCLHLDDLQKQQLINKACPTLCQLQRIAQQAQRRSPAIIAEDPDTFAPNAPSSSAFTATNTHLDILSEIAATTQRSTSTLTPIMEELTRIFSTTPESQTPLVNHMGTNELEEMIDFTPSEA
ncbi:hypothetical protein CVT25_000302 [Psilocybe cyanescens]|uniref:Uncharacterized protein n=1 Tax=Psilocybe cyanescens TaxID=93625 RepID=A0A409XKI6_PSICY|nr:hypothetical protein CVT25_000302 [Psilocybe cyanescens]